MLTQPRTLTGRDSLIVNLEPDAFDALKTSLAGPVLFAGDDGWETAIDIWNGFIHRVPALVVQPTCTEDVAAVVSFARDSGLLMSVKGGGHNIAGTSLTDGGITIDMSRMREVTVDCEAQLVHAGAGCLLEDVDRATQAHGLATVMGIMSEVGIAGLTLGGGFGYLTRCFGWAVDNLVEVEIVTADGQTRIANRYEYPDLFWAIRGGGGNFGVVTRFTYRIHQVGPMVTGGLIAWDARRADEVLAMYRDLTESAPRELTAALLILTAPCAPFVPSEWHGKPIIGMIVCHSGDDPESDLAPVRNLGAPIFDVIGEMPYVEQQSLINPMDPRGLNQYWKAEYFPKLTDGFLSTFRDIAERTPNAHSYSLLFHIGGLLNEFAEDEGAVGNRDARYIAGVSSIWLPGEDGSDQIAWAREAGEAILPFATGGNYVNFQQDEDGEERTRSAYRSNFDRLKKVKTAYDPENVFQVNRNISPARM